MFFDGFPNPNNNCDVQIFTSAEATGSVQFQVWNQPPGKNMAWMLAIGGGGGGGGGFTAAAAAARGGGGGGGSSGHATLLTPIFLLPEVLNVFVGKGGTGVGSGGGTAEAGAISFISINPSSASGTNALLTSGAAAATGGGTGTGAAVGAAGTAGTASAIANHLLAGMGVFTAIAGQAGAAGGAVAGAIGDPIAFPTTGIRTMGGTGGAGTTAANFAGGIITAVAGATLSEQRPEGAAAGSNNGSGGYTLWGPFWNYCGLGGASSNAGVGGLGGTGGHGSGGGGGGGGTTGGRGGDGGGGIVIIVSW